ncbi:AraC family transcriptional regulator [Streptomyces mirabilis]|uniref:AraC family transcriptional regulator n=1 Tax=Streptomyces mirabilis TaxID=68239 RepID=UPI0036DCB819
MVVSLIPECVDVLHDRLARARASGAVFARTVAEPPWGLWLDDPGSAVELVPGEVTLVRGGPDHHIAHEPGAECLEPEDFRARHAYDGSSEDPRATVFLCGAYRFSGDIGSGLLEALPQVLTLSAAIGDPMREVIALLSYELTASEPGQPTVPDRLLDVLLVLAIRNDFRLSSTAPRWYRASADPRLNAALQAMHENAGHPWSIPELAAISGLSRAAFARTFRDALGQTPVQYLTDWRMDLARDHLRTGELGMTHIAHTVGYSSPLCVRGGLPAPPWRAARDLAATGVTPHAGRPGNDPHTH